MFKSILAAFHPAKPGETKPFYLTTEFWGHNLIQLLLWVGALPVAGLPHGSRTVISVAAFVGYSLSRGIAKSGSPFLGSLVGSLGALHFKTGIPAIDNLVALLGGSSVVTVKPTLAPVPETEPDPAPAPTQTSTVVEAVSATQPAGVPPAQPLDPALVNQAMLLASEHPEVIQHLREQGAI